MLNEDLEIQTTVNEDRLEDLIDDEGVVENVVYDTNETTEQGE